MRSCVVQFIKNSGSRWGEARAADQLDWLQTQKPPMQHLVITGRDAPAELLELAELVTEMVNIKHPY